MFGPIDPDRADQTLVPYLNGDSFIDDQYTGGQAGAGEDPVPVALCPAGNHYEERAEYLGSGWEDSYAPRNSYGMNGFFTVRADDPGSNAYKSYFNIDGGDGTNRYGQKFYSVEKPTNRLLFADASTRADGFPYLTDSSGTLYNSNGLGPSARHDGQMNLVFLDGHTESWQRSWIEGADHHSISGGNGGYHPPDHPGFWHDDPVTNTQ